MLTSSMFTSWTHPGMELIISDSTHPGTDRACWHRLTISIWVSWNGVPPKSSISTGVFSYKSYIFLGTSIYGNHWKPPYHHPWPSRSPQMLLETRGRAANGRTCTWLQHGKGPEMTWRCQVPWSLGEPACRNRLEPCRKSTGSFWPPGGVILFFSGRLMSCFAPEMVDGVV